MIEISDYLTGRNQELDELEHQLRSQELEEAREIRRRAFHEYDLKVVTEEYFAVLIFFRDQTILCFSLETPSFGVGPGFGVSSRSDPCSSAIDKEKVGAQEMDSQKNRPR